ncbi:DUF2589 domain-containing protein [Maricaulis salignorans]|uniref:DUF2589 domain-containing protein n=1 Tax=Maricaulis salignorans TaxID=144026 RepID=A0A1G9MYQ8_9PROT|nr:DUF2589 domain-containing protein [Maricaulis salignorans]SDL79368.1 Protein of unknown function [Maricaulis salignorans]
MASEDLISMAQAFSGLPMDQLIGVPLIEACRANNRMALAQTKYILDTGFQQTTNSDGDTVYTPIEITLDLKRPIITDIPLLDSNDEAELDGDGNPIMTKGISTAETTVVLPLISAIPVALIGVDFVRISFDMEVKSSYARDTTQSEKTDYSAAASLEAKFGFGGFSAKITGSVSYHSEKSSEQKEQYSKSNSARYNVEVTAKQQALPQGLAVLLEAFARNVGPYEAAAPA